MTVLHPPPADPVDPGLLSRALEVGGRLANDAAEVLAATTDRAGRTASRTERHLFDWVTHTDHTLERHTRRVLAAEFPDIPVLGPVIGTDYPGDESATSRYRWLVAPVDGALNYLAGLPWYAYSLALLDATGPVVGVISDPTRAEIYAAARGRGTRVNGVPVRVARQPGRPDPGSGYPVCVDPGTLASACAARREVRVLGSAALAITQVALGNAAAAVLEEYRAWDVAAGLALALEAGAVVLDRHGRPNPFATDGLLVAVPSAVTEVLGWWQRG